MTRDGILRHPVFLHLRDDKKPAEVKPETETVQPKAASTKIRKVKNSTQPKEKKTTKIKATKTKSAAASEPEAEQKKKSKNKIVVANNHKIEISNFDKIYWPVEGLTKGDMINYYDTMADYILPYLKDRPLSLKRNPNGLLDTGFYQKNAGDIAPEWMETARIHSESGDKYIQYLVCNNKASLLFIANLGCIEMNPWNSTTRKEGPTYLDGH